MERRWMMVGVYLSYGGGFGEKIVGGLMLRWYFMCRVRRVGILQGYTLREDSDFLRF